MTDEEQIKELYIRYPYATKLIADDFFNKAMQGL